MSVFDKYLLKKDNLLKRRIEIDNSLYEKLVELSNIYDASINKLVNIAIINMIETENVELYEKKDNEIVEKRTLSLPEMVTGVIKCKNPRCITTIEQELPHVFFLADKEKKVYR